MSNINKCSFSSILMLLIFFGLNKGFDVIPFASFYSICGNQQEIFVVILIFIYLFINKKFRIKKTIFSKDIIFFTVYYFFEFFLSYMNNGQGLADVFISSNFYLSILFYFVCLDYLQKYGIDKLFKLIISFSLIRMSLCWIQYFFAFKNIIFMTNGLAYRFGQIRLHNYGDVLNNFAIIISSAKILTKESKNRIFDYIFVTMGIIGMLILSKGRIQLLALFLSIVSIVIFKYHKKKKIFLYIVLLLLFMGAFFQTNIGKMYLSSLTDIETDTMSIRRNEWAYYNAQTKEHLLFGVGFIRDNGDIMSNYLKGPAHAYSRTDIGIMGVANALGIIGALWYIITTIKMIRILYVCRRDTSINYCCLLGFVVYSIVSIPTVILFNAYGITAYAMLLSLCSFYYRKRSITECL